MVLRQPLVPAFAGQRWRTDIQAVRVSENDGKHRTVEQLADANTARSESFEAVALLSVVDRARVRELAGQALGVGGVLLRPQLGEPGPVGRPSRC